MKEIIKSTFFYFFIAATFTGSLYKIIENPKNEPILKLISINLLFLLIAFLFSYFGYKSQQKKNKKKL